MLVLATNLVIKQTMAGRHRTLTIVSAGQRFECTRVSNTLPIPWELAVSYATLSNWTCNAPFGGANLNFMSRPFRCHTSSLHCHAAQE